MKYFALVLLVGSVVAGPNTPANLLSNDHPADEKDLPRLKIHPVGPSLRGPVVRSVK